MRQSSVRLVAVLGLALALFAAAHHIGAGPDGPVRSHPAPSSSTSAGS